MPFLLYILPCIAVAFAGRKRTIGFVGFLLLSLALTPFVSALVLLCGTRDPRVS